MKINTKQTIYKDVMANYPTGVTVMTTRDQQGNPVGMTVNSFASVSLDPLLILWSIDRRVSSFQSFMQADRFAVNILAADQSHIGKLFASKEDRFAKSKWESSKSSGLPVLQDVCAVMECKIFNKVQAGDHVIIIGEVMEIVDYGKDPLLYHKRKFGKLPSDDHNHP